MESPLVTVSVITYKSAETVLETLDSIYAQTYPSIELVVSDDCSPDNTVAICRQWIADHKNRFTDCRIIESDRNTGITANCNRAISDIKGDYLKLLAGDDLLEPDAICEFVSYMQANPDALYVFCKIGVFGNDKEKVDHLINSVINYSFFSLNKKEQYLLLIGHHNASIPAPSVFINAKGAKEAGVLFYDERIPMLEDWPKWIELSSKGIEFHFIDKQLVRYRIGDNSASTGEHYRKAFNKSLALLYRHYQFKPTIRHFGLLHAMIIYINKMALYNGHSVWGVLNRIVISTINVRNTIRKALSHRKTHI